MQAQYGQGAAPSHHPPPYTPSKVLQPNGGGTTSSLRQWRKKDFIEKQASSETSQSTTNEHPSHIARVAPHTYYPRPPEDPCNYQQQFTEYSATYKPPVPVKYSEIVENQQPQPIDHIAPVIQKQKEKEYVDLCNGPHLPMKPSAYPDPLSLQPQYIPKDSQMYPFVQKQYVQKEPYQQFLSKYNMQNQFHPPQSPYNSQPNDFLAHLNKINPRMAQSIINDTHLRDTQIPMYHNLDQGRPPPFPQPQRMYHSPTANASQRNFGGGYNYTPQYNYNRMHQYHNASKYVPEQQRYYNDVNYGPFPPSYPQMEYAQHYQHRRHFPQDYYVHYKGAYPPEETQNAAETATRKSSLKQYLESWVEEDMTGGNSAESVPLKGGGDAPDPPLYVLDTTDIPNDNLPHFLHLQQVEKLPDNIKGYYQEEEEVPSVAKESDKEETLVVPEIFDRECSIVATVEKCEQVATASENLQEKVVQIHIMENAEAIDAEVPVTLNADDHEGVGKDSVASDNDNSNTNSPGGFKSMPEINGEANCDDQSAIGNLEEVIKDRDSCDTIDLGNITTNTSKDCEKTEEKKEDEVVECLDSILEEITLTVKECVETTKECVEELLMLSPPPSNSTSKRKQLSKPKRRKKRKGAEEETTSAPDLELESEPLQADENEDMPVLEREVLDSDETETNVVYQVDDSNVVLQIGDELLEIIVTVQNDKKIIMVKTFSDAVIMNNSDDAPCPVLEEQPALDAPPPLIEDVEEIVPSAIANDVCVYNEEVVSSSTVEVAENLPEESVHQDEQDKCLEPELVKENFKTKAALKLLEPQEVTKVPMPKQKAKKKRAGDVTKIRSKHKEQRKVEPRKSPVKHARAKRKDEKRDRIRKNNVDMLYKMSIVPSGALSKNKADDCSKHKEEKVNVQEHSITSSSEAGDPRKHVDKIIQQINDDWEDDLDAIKQEDTCKRRLSLQEYNDRKRMQEQEKHKVLDYEKLDLTSNLLQDVARRREASPTKPNATFITRTYSRDKKDEPLSSRIELQLPNQRRILPKANYNQEYLRNALMNDLHTVNQITATLMKENQELMQRFLEQQRLSASELKKVKQIIRYKRLVHHLTNMKLKETETCNHYEAAKVTEKRKKRRFRFLHSDSEPELHEPPPMGEVPAAPADYSVHQSNSQGQLTLVFKRSFKTDPKMQPFVKLERIRSLDWLASKLQ